MNKSAIQKFAIWARTTLMEQVAQRAYQYGITKDSYGEENAVTVNGMALSPQEQSQRRELVREIQAKGYDQVMEEVAYTWFNRFIALRYMEVNNYLPSHIRVFSNAQGAFDPEILKEALHIDLPGLDQSRVAEYIEKNETEALYRYLLLTQCNALNEGLPKMFEKMGGYTELLFPNNMLRPDSVLGRMVADIPEEDWTDQVQIIGWLYQYYNTELKAETFDLLKKNVKVTKERIPSATQLFTPDWIVRYMVENSLGRLWLEGHPNPALRENWKYYLDEAEQEPEVEAQLVVLRAQRQTLRPEDITLIDPCMGSGHILVYAFDVLMQIYESEGWSQRDAAASIVQKNLYGLDIDRRAAQLAYFAVMMKARQYDRRFLTRGIQPNLYHPAAYAEGQEFGSLLIVDELEPKPEQPDEITLFDGDYADKLNTWNFRSLLARQYDVVVTNPPYMGSDNMNIKLYSFCKEHYPNSRFDLCAAMIERCNRLTSKNSFEAMITQHSWMYLQSYELLRQFILNNDIVNMTHLGAHAFEELAGEVVQTTAFVLRKTDIFAYRATYVRLNDIPTPDGKEAKFAEAKGNYVTGKEKFKHIPAYNFGYWASPNMLKSFDECVPLSAIAQPRQGLASGNNSFFYRFWSEIDKTKLIVNADCKEKVWSYGFRYVPVNKGGGYCKWYGNNLEVLKFDESSYNLLLNSGNHLPSRDKYFLPGVTWGKIASSGFSCRFSPTGFVFTDSGMKITGEENVLKYICAFLHSKVAPEFLKIFSETIHYETGNIAKLPIQYSDSEEQIIDMVNCNIELAKSDWDAYETSWDFKRHPLV